MRRLLLGLICGLCIASSGEARPSSRKTILDHYLAMKTDNRFGPYQDDQAARLASIKVRDLRRGYLEVDDVEMKLFRMADGTELIAQGYTGCCCEGQCIRMIRFLAVRNDSFEDVTREVWPTPHDESAWKLSAARRRLPAQERFRAADLVDQAVYRLSRNSAAIHIEVDGHRLLTFRWTGRRFARR
jgi:hypothetical protein